MLLQCFSASFLSGTNERSGSPRQAVCLATIVAAIAIAVSGCGSTSTSAVAPSPVKCAVSLSGPNTIGAAGGTGTITVTTQPECAWTSSTQVPWITRLSPRSGQGTGQVTFETAANALQAARQGDIVVNDVRFQVHQDFATCVLGVGTNALSVAATGGTHSVTVSAGDGCAWSASTSASWIAITSGEAGSGNGTVSVQVSANTGSARAGTLLVAGRTVTISQSAGGTTSCSYSIQPTSASVSASGGQGTIAVASESGCAWSAASDVSWIAVTSGVAGNGNGTVGYNIEPNTSAPRVGHLTVAGETLTVNQSAGSLPCDYSIQPTSRAIGANGGPVAVSVTVTAGCVWTATSQAPWITVASGASGNGSGGVNLDVALNTGAQRTGTATVAGLTFTVTQAVGCTYSVQPAQISLGAGGGPSSTSVTTGEDCGWTASSQVPWITISSGAAGSGDGTVGIDVAANSSPQRTGTLTVAGQTVTVSQASGCTYGIVPTAQSIGSGGGFGSTLVSTSEGCAWTASSNVSWITITSGGSGSGSAIVGFDVDANTSPARVGTLTIANQTFTVSQASGCTYAVQPLAVAVTAGGGSRSVSVTSGVGCPWTAESHAPWIGIGTGSGSGSGAVDVSVSPNQGPQRTGTLTVAGHTVSVIQEDGCTYSLSPPSASFTALGGAGTVAVTTFPGCTWTAISNVSWITILSGESGNGSGIVIYQVAPLVVGKRSGSITIGDDTFVVTQPN